MLRIKKRHNIKASHIIVFNETVVYYMKIDVCQILLRKFLFTSEATVVIFPAKAMNLC